MARLFRRIRYWLRQRARDAALHDEIEFHRALTQQALEADGLPSDAARAAAARAIGNVTRAREDARAEWVWPWLDSVRQTRDSPCAGCCASPAAAPHASIRRRRSANEGDRQKLSSFAGALTALPFLMA